MTHPNCKNPVDTESRPPSLNIAIAKLMMDGRERTALDILCSLASTQRIDELKAALKGMTIKALLVRSQIDGLSVYRAAKFVGRGNDATAGISNEVKK